MQFTVILFATLFLSSCSSPSSGAVQSLDSHSPTQATESSAKDQDISWSPDHLDDQLGDGVFWKVLLAKHGSGAGVDPLDPSHPSDTSQQLPALLPAKVGSFVAQILLRSEPHPISTPVTTIESWDRWKKGATCVRTGAYSYLIAEEAAPGRLRILRGAMDVSFLLDEADSRAVQAVLDCYSESYADD